MIIESMMALVQLILAVNNPAASLCKTKVGLNNQRINRVMMKMTIYQTTRFMAPALLTSTLTTGGFANELSDLVSIFNRNIFLFRPNKNFYSNLQLY